MGSKFSNDRHGAWGSKSYWGNFDIYGKPCKKENERKHSSDSGNVEDVGGVSCADKLSSSGELSGSDNFCCQDNIFSRLEEIYAGNRLGDASGLSDNFSLDSFNSDAAPLDSKGKRRLVLRCICVWKRLFFNNPFVAGEDDCENGGFSGGVSVQLGEDLPDLLSLSLAPVDISKNSTSVNPYDARPAENFNSERGSVRGRVRRVGSISPDRRQSVRHMRKTVRERRVLETRMQKVRERLADAEKSISAKGIRRVSRISRKVRRSADCEIKVHKFKIHYGDGDVYFVPGKIVSHYRKHSKLLRTNVKMLRDRRKFFETKTKALNDDSDGGGGAGGNVVTKSNQPLLPRDIR